MVSLRNMSNQPDPRINLLCSILSVIQGPNGVLEVNAIRAPKIVTQVVYATGDLYFLGPVLTPLILNDGITSSSGDLVIGSATGNINMSGKTLTNVGGIVTNPNYTQIFGSVTTANASSTQLISIPTTTGTSYLLQTTITASNTTSTTDSATFIISIKATNNLAGSLSITSPFNTITSVDASLSTCTVAYAVSGINILINVTGVAATTIKWFCASQITSSAF